MMIKKTYLIFIICILYNAILLVPASAGGDPRRVVSLSPPDRVADKFRFDLQSHMADIVYRNPALYEWQNANGAWGANTRQPAAADSASLLRKTVVYIRHSDGEISGDYLPYYGNAFTDSEITAEGIYGTARHGTIFGSASFAKGRHSGYGWNAIRHAELYLPYLIADSTGGDYKYENYYIEGGYSFRLNNSFYGVGAHFRGEIASRQTDPRCANTTSWLILDAAAAFPLRAGGRLSIRASYLRNKQYLNLRNWRPNQQDRFFVTYGFGYYDLQKSPVSFGIRRMYYLRGIQTQITYSNPGYSDRATAITADIEYSFSAMKTEEADAMNLFGSDTHSIKGALWLTSNRNGRLRWMFGVQTENQLRRGKENIYETYRPDEDYPSIYDFRLIDTRKPYTSASSSNLMQGKIGYYLSKPRLMLELLCGVGADYRSELYELPAHHWSVFSAYPICGIGAKRRSKKIEWGINSQLFMRFPLTYDYDVSGGKFRIDYQETFLPYAFYTDKSFNLRNEIHVSFPVNNNRQRIGLNVQYYLRKGYRPAGVAYGQTPGVISHLLSQPASATVKNHESWISAGLFILM